MTTLHLIKPTTEREAGYLAALRLVALVDANLEVGRVHYRDSQGRLITHFDEWLTAVEAGRWPPAPGSLRGAGEELRRAA